MELHSVVEETRYLSHCFNTRKPTAYDNERQQRTPRIRAIFEIRIVEKSENMVAYDDCITKGLQGKGMLSDAGYHARVGDATKSEHEVIEVKMVVMSRQAMCDGDSAILEVDGLNVGCAEACTPEEMTDGIDDVAWVEAARSDFRQHRLEDKEVLFADEGDGEIFRAAEFSARRVESSTKLMAESFL